MNESADFVFGPLPSRRLWRSLGVSPIPMKTCNYSCVYCQLGRTDKMTGEREDRISVEALLCAVKAALSKAKGPIDYVTIAGEGEPTLYKSLDRLVRGIREATDIPVAVITNGSLLWDADVREALASADLVMPSLDAADKETFRRVNRPHGHLNVEQMVEGLVRFRQEFTGRIWMEVMMVKGVNDSLASLRAIADVLADVRPDRTYLNLPVRPPAERWAVVPDPETVERARELLGAEVVEEAEIEAGVMPPESSGGDILSIVRRHPMSIQEIERELHHLGTFSVHRLVDDLIAADLLRKVRHGETDYFVAPEGSYATGLDPE